MSSGNSSLFLLALSTAPVSSWSRKPTPGFHLHKLSPFSCVSARTRILWTMIFVRSQVGWASYCVWTHIKIWIIKAKNTGGILLNLTVQWYSWQSGTGSWEKKPFYKDNSKHIWLNHGVQIITHSPGMGVGCGLQRSDLTRDTDGKKEWREANSVQVVWVLLKMLDSDISNRKLTIFVNNCYNALIQNSRFQVI